PTATDAEIPSGKSAGPAGGAPDMVAFNIPLPTWRPESPTRQLEADKSGDAVAALLALNHADDGHNGLAGQRVSVAQSKPEDRVRTSPKADRVQPNLDPEATAVIVPAALSRPIETGRGIAGGASPAAPVIAANLIRTAPEHIYLDGFQPRGRTSDHRRFTGSAVKFLPIASFK
ncbi:peptidase M15, partial [Mesorhizobium sp. M7A.F.Ca.CA.004.11.2.1]